MTLTWRREYCSALAQTRGRARAHTPACMYCWQLDQDLKEVICNVSSLNYALLWGAGHNGQQDLQYLASLCHVLGDHLQAEVWIIRKPVSRHNATSLEFGNPKHKIPEVYFHVRCVWSCMVLLQHSGTVYDSDGSQTMHWDSKPSTGDGYLRCTCCAW
jgi:hypothetical protein